MAATRSQRRAGHSVRLGLQPSSWTDILLERVWKVVRNPRWRSFTGWLSEAETIDRLELAGLPIFRTLDGAPCDALLLYRLGEDVDGSVPPVTTSWDRYKWVQKWLGHCEYLEVDIKYHGLSRVTTDSEMYRLSEFGMGRESYTESSADIAELMIVKSEALPRYQAWVPRVVYSAGHKGHSYGVEQLRSPGSWYMYPLMIAEEDVAEAWRLLQLTIRDPENSPFRNPTTGVVLKSWRPRTTFYPRTHPRPGATEAIDFRQIGSAHVQRLWDALQNAGARVHLNPVQPLICDFLLMIPALADTIPFLFVEFKLGWFFDTGTRSPFHAYRQWHFTICQDSHRYAYLCIPRHAVHPSWSEAVALHRDERASFMFEGPQAIPEMLKYMTAHAEASVDKANEVARTAYHLSTPELQEGQLTPPSGSRGGRTDAAYLELALESFSPPFPAAGDFSQELERMGQMLELTLHGADPGDDDRDDDREAALFTSTHVQLSETPTPQQSNDVPHELRLPTDTGLPWLGDLINDLCMQARSMLCLPLGPNHPWGSHVLAKFVWEQSHVHLYAQGRLPCPLFARELADSRCIVLRLWDLSGASAFDSPSDVASPLHIRHEHVRTLASAQRFVVLGSTMAAEHTNATSLAHSVLILPSDLTTFHEFPIREPRPEMSLLEKYRTLDRAVGYMDIKEFQYRSCVPLRKGSECLQPKVDPARHIATTTSIADFSLYANLRNILYHDGVTNVQVLEGARQNPTFHTRPYHTTIRAVLQAAWDFGRECKTNIFLYPRVKLSSYRQTHKR